MDVGTIFPYLRYMPGTGDFGEGEEYAFDTSKGDYGQVTLSPAWQLSTHTGAFPTNKPIVKRVTMQVAQLNYQASPEVAPEITSDMQSKEVLMDFNTEDLYTKARGSDEWEGPWPQFNRDYAKVGYGDDTDTIRPIKGAPVRFRKIPLCTTQGTGYFYALASAPYIITGIRENNPSKETGYLSDWTPTETQLSIECADCADITGNFPYGSIFEMFPDLSEEDDIADIYRTGYSNLFSGITKDASLCKYDFTFRSITGAGCVETVQDDNLIYISGTSSISGNHYPIDLDETFDEFQLQRYSNIYSGNAGNTCSGNLMFRSITGNGTASTYIDGNIIKVSGHSITGTGSVRTFHETVNNQSYIVISGHTGTAENITGLGCIETKNENIGDTPYTTIRFTGQAITTGNLDTSNLFAVPGMTNDNIGCSANSKRLNLKTLRGVTGVKVVKDDDSTLHAGMDCQVGGLDGWFLDPGDTVNPGTNNPLHDCGFRLQCVEFCADGGGTYTAFIPVRYVNEFENWTDEPDTDSPSCSSL